MLSCRSAVALFYIIVCFSCILVGKGGLSHAEAGDIFHKEISSPCGSCEELLSSSVHPLCRFTVVLRRNRGGGGGPTRELARGGSLVAGQGCENYVSINMRSRRRAISFNWDALIRADSWQSEQHPLTKLNINCNCNYCMN